jgi:GTP-dependent phosphoenolpyruvate carboxykinase
MKGNSVLIKKCRNMKMLYESVTLLDEGLSVERLFILKVEKSPNAARNSVM